MSPKTKLYLSITLLFFVSIFYTIDAQKNDTKSKDQKSLGVSVSPSHFHFTQEQGQIKTYDITVKNGRFEFYLHFGSYSVTMDEVILNDRFRVTRNNLPIKLRNDQDGVYVSFYIIEKRRKVIFKDFTKKKKD
jgi:hypothetical protein